MYIMMIRDQLYTNYSKQRKSLLVLTSLCPTMWPRSHNLKVLHGERNVVELLNYSWLNTRNVNFPSVNFMDAINELSIH